ncbi:MAG: hypothetical protein J3K34DRAFT_476400 [Monoraphidium minutum]|nr:MAG: hypothetical protein J3K34DRAFT_476400 [Monoraphidium minutum]
MQEAPPAEEGGEGEGGGEGEEYYDYEEEGAEIDYSLPFPAEIPMDSNTAALASIPLPLYYPAVMGLAAVAGFVGAAAGRGMPVSPSSRDVVAYSTAALAAGAVIYGGVQAKKVRDRAAVVDLFNLLVYMDDPSALTQDDVAAAGAKYGVDMKRDQLEGVQQIFGQYLEGVVPKGDQPLRGDEASKILAFKEALGLSDEEVAPAFIEVGRRLSRAGWEAGKDRQAQFEQRKAFQRLIYLSYAALGDVAAASLLPWQTEFGLNDAQLFVARRDNSRAVFGAHLAENYNGDLPADADALRALREFQAGVKLLDDVAADSTRCAPETGGYATH